jgi:hypothetical protein
MSRYDENSTSVQEAPAKPGRCRVALNHDDTVMPPGTYCFLEQWDEASELPGTNRYSWSRIGTQAE